MLGTRYLFVDRMNDWINECMREWMNGLRMFRPLLNKELKSGNNSWLSLTSEKTDSRDSPLHWVMPNLGQEDSCPSLSSAEGKWYICKIFLHHFLSSFHFQSSFQREKDFTSGESRIWQDMRLGALGALFFLIKNFMSYNIFWLCFPPLDPPKSSVGIYLTAFYFIIWQSCKLNSMEPSCHYIERYSSSLGKNVVGQGLGSMTSLSPDSSMQRCSNTALSGILQENEATHKDWKAGEVHSRMPYLSPNLVLLIPISQMCFAI